MKFFALITISCLLALGSMAQKKFVLDENAVMRTGLENFRSIKVSGGIDVYISQASEEAVAVSAAEEGFRNNIKTEVRENILHIWYDGSFSNLRSAKKLKVYVGVVHLESLNVSGASDVIVVGPLMVGNLNLEIAGASDFIGEVQCNELSVSASGASDLRLSGKAQKAHLNCSGASDIKGYDFEAQECSISASGASEIRISVLQKLKAKASGASSIFYKGSPSIIESDSGGASSIQSKN